MPFSKVCVCGFYRRVNTLFNGYCFSFIHYSIVNKRIVALSNSNCGSTPPYVFLFE